MKPLARKATSLLFTSLATALPLQADETPKLHPVEKACVEYLHEGQMINGSSIRCHKDFAYRSYQIEKLEMGIAGFVQKQNQHIITIGETIYTINPEKRSGTRTKNPFYEQLAGSMDGKAKDVGERFMQAMGYKATGETKTIANKKCEVYQSSQLGTVCNTPEGVMLEQFVMGNTTRATRVAIGEAGEQANYDLYKQVKITQGPDLSRGLQGIESLEGIEGLQDLLNPK